MAGTKVLLIDDEAALLEEIEEGLQDLGYHVATATSGAEGLRRLEAERPDLVVCDMAMPGMTGQEVLTAVRQRDDALREVPFVFLTAHGDVDAEMLARLSGADDWVRKPVDLDYLGSVIAGRIGRTADLRGSWERRRALAEARIRAAIGRRSALLLRVEQRLMPALRDLSGAAAFLEVALEGIADENCRKSLDTIRERVGELDRELSDIHVVVVSTPLDGRIERAPANPDDAVSAGIGMVRERVLNAGLRLGFDKSGMPDRPIDAAKVSAAVAGTLSWIAHTARGSTCRIALSSTGDHLAVTFAVADADARMAESWNRRRDPEDGGNELPEIALDTARDVAALHSGKASFTHGPQEAVVSLTFGFQDTASEPDPEGPAPPPDGATSNGDTSSAASGGSISNGTTGRSCPKGASPGPFKNAGPASKRGARPSDHGIV
jgi:CheY-like chemotaxis protein